MTEKLIEKMKTSPEFMSLVEKLYKQLTELSFTECVDCKARLAVKIFDTVSDFMIFTIKEA